MTLSWTVFVDRCVGGRRLKPLLIEAGWSVVLHDEVFEQDAPDVDWPPVVAASGQVVLTRDKQIRRRPDELLPEADVGRGRSNEELRRAVVPLLEQMQRACPGP